MTNPSQRMHRVADLIQKELARILQLDTGDPRFHGVTISCVEVSRNLAQARIYITVLESSTLDDTMKALVKASKYLRHQLAQAVSLRIIPELHFFYDESVAQGAHLSDLIKSAPVSSEDAGSKKEK